jgi:serine/threonine protein phosphatase PrpC
MLVCNIKSFSCSKAGNSLDENEDRFIIPHNGHEGGPIRIAVADGATESSFSKEWAELLVDHYGTFSDFDTRFFQNIFPTIRKTWLERINYDNLEWYAQQKLEMGAFASFLGVTIDLSTGEINATAVGDSNLFVFRGRKMQNAFPIPTAEGFGNTPFLISTELHKNQTSEPFFSQLTISLLPSDILILGTDAISQWILQGIEHKNYPVDQLIDLLNHESGPPAFKTWLDEKRETGNIKNDDTTIILIQIT